MKSLVLALKYRPNDFTEMVGQNHVVQALTNALTTKRLHHAYLFTGTRGVGKTTVSRILAKSLNCQGSDGHGGITCNPCGVCQSCVDIDGGRFIDYTELDAASNRGVEDIQSLLQQAVYKPVQGRFKVFMIDEVHMLTTTAFNSMLNILEEPPEYLKFILATTDPQKVPVTVLSRCLQFNLRPMAPETIFEHLTKVLDIEGIKTDIASLHLIARGAKGSMRDALSLTDQAIAFGGGQLEEQTVRQMLGSVDTSYVFELIEALAHGDGKSIVTTSATLRLHGVSPTSTLEEMSSILQRMAVFQAVPEYDSELDDGNPNSADILRLAVLMPPDETQLLYSICLNGISELSLAPDEYAALTMVLFRLLAFKPTSSDLYIEKKSLLEARIKDIVVPKDDKLFVSTSSSISTKDIDFRSVKSSFENTGPKSEVVPLGQGMLIPSGQKVPIRHMELPAASGGNQVPYVVEDIQPISVRVQKNSDLDNHIPSTELPGFIRTSEGDFWFELVESLLNKEVVTALARELALQSQLIARDNERWLLKVERESLSQSGVSERLEAALALAGHVIKLSMEIGRVTDSPSRRISAALAEKQLVAEKIIYNDPYVEILMRDFGAKIVPNSIKSI